MPVPMQCDLRELLPFCTPEQLPKIESLIAHKTYKRAAAATGLNERTIQRTVQHVKLRAIMAGNIPELGIRHRSPNSLPLHALSVFNQRTEDAPAHWAKYKVDDLARQRLFESFVAGITDDLPRIKPVPTPRVKSPDLMNLITLTDCHVGMYAWARESGASWDLAIAERTLVGAAIGMMDGSPAADTCVIAELGDWNHYDGHIAKTPVHGHPLDAAGRPGEMIEASVRILKRVIHAALLRYKKVVLLVAQGNHDMQSYKWLRMVMAAAYEKEKRLTIIHEESPFYVYQHGSVMLGFHHGHTTANEALPLLFASHHAETWGATKYRYAHTGHRHHKHVKEHPGMTVYQHSTLAAADNHASSNGYKSHRQAEAMTYHREFGLVSSMIVTPEMLLRAA